MELLQLTDFYDAALTEKFSKTAEKYKVPPSNISQSIKRLEKELSIALFDRRANRVVLNDRGRAFYQQVRQALDLLESARTAAAGHGAEDRLRLVIHVNRRIVMKAVERFQSHCPAVNIFTTHGFSGEQEADLIVSDQVMGLPGAPAGNSGGTAMKRASGISRRLILSLCEVQNGGQAQL